MNGSGFINPTNGVQFSGSLGLRNRIVNGDMRIDQENAGAAVSVNAAAIFNSVDKWRAFGTNAAGVFSIQQQTATPPNGFSHYLRATVTTADAAPAAASIYRINQNIEGNYMADLQFGIAANGKSVSIGFWVRSSLSGVFSGSLVNSAGNRSYPFVFTVNNANTWEYKNIAVPADQAGVWLGGSSLGCYFIIDLGNGANWRGASGAWAAANLNGATGATRLISTLGATFDLTGVQLEPGPAATEFEQRPFGDMLRLCQREFCKSFNHGTAPAQAVGVNTGEHLIISQWAGALGSWSSRVPFPVSMRAAPVITFYNPVAANAFARDESAGANCTATTASNISENGFHFSTVPTAAGAIGNRLKVHWTADARL